MESKLFNRGSNRERFDNPLRVGLSIEKKPEPSIMVIFGGSGDLAYRKLIPSLFNLFMEKRLPEDFYIVGVGRRPVTNEDFREKLFAGVKEFSRIFSGNKADFETFSKRIFFFSTQSEEDSTAYYKLAAFLKNLPGTASSPKNYVFYLAIPPNHFESTIDRLGKSGLSKEYTDGVGFSRVVVEKPFGSSLSTARRLNKKFMEYFYESQVYRIDHYLGKETVQNIMVFRFANGIFEPIWNRNMIDCIQITMSEEIGIGGRGEYFEKSGMIRDIVQNHIMQLISLIAMEPPIGFEGKSIRDEKLKVVRSIRPIMPESVHKSCLRGQYRSGWVGGEAVKCYVEEEKVDRDSSTETFLALKLFVDNWRFKGVPFYIRTGKRLPKRVTEVVIQFKGAPHTLFDQNNLFAMDSNLLVLRIQPDEGISLKFNSKVPNQATQMRPVNMDFSYGSSFGVDSPDAYERLLLDSLLGDSSLFLRADELEASWRVIDPIIEGWELYRELNPVYPYMAGSWGPKESMLFMAKDNRAWRRP